MGGPSPLLGLSAFLCQGVQNRQRGKAQIGAVCCSQYPPFSSAGGPPPSDPIPRLIRDCSKSKNPRAKGVYLSV